jgi:hypothetical protein
MLPVARLVLEVQSSPVHGGGPGIIKGAVKVLGWAPAPGERDLCFYLPYQDPEYGDNFGTQRRFEMLTGKAPKLTFENGATRFDLPHNSPFVLQVGDAPHLVRVTPPSGWDAEADGIEFSFESSVPRLPDSDPNDWFFDGYGPQPLYRCPPTGTEPRDFDQGPTMQVSATVTHPPGWDYVGPGKVSERGATVEGLPARHLAFALGRGYTHESFMAAGVPVHFAFRSPGFRDAVATVQEAIAALQPIFGAYPYQTLTVVETSELQRHGLPGLVAVNRPAQAAFSYVQKDWLNWQHWIVAMQLARQWYGAAITAPSPDDEWLLAGMVEFATLETLARIPRRYNLFAVADDGYRALSFDYLQISEISAATLRRFAPFAALTGADLRTRDAADDQHPLLFVKQAFALRQLKFAAGEGPFAGFLRNLTAQHLYGQLAPADLHTFLARLPSPFPPPVRQDLQTYLARWWTSEGWPDFALTRFDSEQLADGRWVAHVEAVQEGAVDFPPRFRVHDVVGETHEQRATQGEDGVWKATILTRDEPDRAVVDAAHEAFDSDRFDNKSTPPAITFFPGSADTLRDDAYTVIWLPYVFRRPGEQFSIGLQAAGFRYIQGGTVLRAEATPSSKLGAFELRHVHQWPRHALQGGIGVDQNYDNDRTTEASLTRAPLYLGNPRIDVTARVRRKQRVGEPETAHGALGGAVNLRPAGRTRHCGGFLALDHDDAPESFANDFSYRRRFGVLAGDCNLTPRTNLAVRVFAGRSDIDGDAPETAYFKPTELKEARLRLDVPGLPRPQRILTSNVDVSLPFYLPLPADSLVLARQMRWRLFSDRGRSELPDADYQSAGMGFLVPLGGDVAGAGTLAVTRLSVLAILYSRIDDEVSRKPGVVFDLTGEL